MARNSSQYSFPHRQRITQLCKPIACIVALGLSQMAGCAGYQVGNQALFQNGIRSVHVPVIESETHRRFLGQQLTEAVVKRIEQDTPLSIAAPGFCDSVLTCRIIRDRKQSKTLDRFGEPRVIETGWVVEMDWVDRSGVSLLRLNNLKVSDRVEFIPEGGQSLSTAQRELIDRVARQIVGQLESGW